MYECFVMPSESFVIKSVMMLLTHKKLLTGARENKTNTSKKLCLVITFDDGMRVQYAVKNELEALDLYRQYSRLHPNLRLAEQN
jgi:hypothetical protein